MEHLGLRVFSKYKKYFQETLILIVIIEEGAELNL